MIESILIANAATFGNSPNPPEVLKGLLQVNFVYGSNGTGKTTISRIISEASRYPACRVNWRNGTALQSVVYNQDFIEKNFNQVPDLKGVFTLGVKNIETLKKIDEAKVTCDRLTQESGKLTVKLEGEDGNGGKRKELADLEIGLKESCWKQKIKHEIKLQRAFDGYRNSAEKFKEKILQESASNTAIPTTLAELEKKAETVFGAAPLGIPSFT